MSLEPGTTLGPYEILARIGAGAMGEVYEARDTKLERHVAIKVLRDELARDEERLARFEREAKLLASVNHPHIAGIYGFESGALVLELVEGPTLAQRIEKGPILAEEVIAIARQIAEALEAGHEAGIIHRDLKPSNIKLKDDGTVKVLDYGLAKALHGNEPTGAPSSGLSESPTLTRHGTQLGVILGTAAYMSPEQAKGKSVDERTDVWAFGAVVYEMLTGKRAFPGEDVSETLAAVLRAEPNWNLLPGETPPTLKWVLKLCLNKDAKRRVHDIADARLAMEGAFDTHIEAPEPVAAPRRTLPWVAAVFAALLTGGFLVWSLMRTDPPEVTRFAYELPAGHVLRFTNRPVLAVSPDGRRFAYNTTNGVYLRSMDQLDALLLPGTEESVRSVIFSPDGQWIAYDQGNQLKRLALSGGAPVVICPVSDFLSADWAADDTIYFADTEGIFRVSANGGTKELVIPATDGEVLDAPRLLPDGDRVLVSVSRRGGDWDEGRIEAVSLETGERSVLVEGGSDALYLDPGHLVYALGDGLFAVAFDVASLRVTSGPVSMVQGLRRAGRRAGFAASANYTVSNDGTLFFLSDASASSHRLAWVTRTGRAEVIGTIPAGNYVWPRLSPDGERVLVLADGDAWVYDLESGRENRLTTDGTILYPGWTPSGDEVTYTSGGEVWTQPVDGSGEARQLTALGGEVHFDAWAPDGRTFSAHHHIGGTVNQLMIAYDGENGHPEAWLEHDHRDLSATFSPDGRYVAYVSEQTGQYEVYIRPFPGPGGQTPVSVGGGREPAWTSSGELFYRRERDYRMMVVQVQTEPVLRLRPPVELFAGSRGGEASPSTNYAVTGDGHRFLMTTDLLASGETDSRDAGGTKVIVVQNWVEELKERVPN